MLCIYLLKVLLVNNFLGISWASSVLGGFLADAYFGRYWTIAIFTTIYLLGPTGITLCATMNVLMPNQDKCDQIALLLGCSTLLLGCSTSSTSLSLWEQSWRSPIRRNMNENT